MSEWLNGRRGGIPSGPHDSMSVCHVSVFSFCSNTVVNLEINFHFFVYCPIKNYICILISNKNYRTVITKPLFHLSSSLHINKRWAGLEH